MKSSLQCFAIHSALTPHLICNISTTRIPSLLYTDTGAHWKEIISNIRDGKLLHQGLTSLSKVSVNRDEVERQVKDLSEDSYFTVSLQNSRKYLQKYGSQLLPLLQFLFPSLTLASVLPGNYLRPWRSHSLIVPSEASAGAEESKHKQEFRHSHSLQSDCQTLKKPS